VLVELRRKLVSQGEVEARLQEAMTKLGRYGNSFGASPRTRAKVDAGAAVQSERRAPRRPSIASG